MLHMCHKTGGYTVNASSETLTNVWSTAADFQQISFLQRTLRAPTPCTPPTRAMR